MAPPLPLRRFLGKFYERKKNDNRRYKKFIGNSTVTEIKSYYFWDYPKNATGYGDFGIIILWY